MTQDELTPIDLNLGQKMRDPEYARAFCIEYLSDENVSLIDTSPEGIERMTEAIKDRHVDEIHVQAMLKAGEVK